MSGQYETLAEAKEAMFKVYNTLRYETQNHPDRSEIMTAAAETFDALTQLAYDRERQDKGVSK